MFTTYKYSCPERLGVIVCTIDKHYFSQYFEKKAGLRKWLKEQYWRLAALNFSTKLFEKTTANFFPKISAPLCYLQMLFKRCDLLFKLLFFLWYNLTKQYKYTIVKYEDLMQYRGKDLIMQNNSSHESPFAVVTNSLLFNH